MKTIKCDRCGKEIPYVPPYMNVAQQGIVPPKITMIAWDAVSQTTKEIDLCDKCQIKVYDYIFNTTMPIIMKGSCGMTNEQNIRNLPLRDLASLVIRREYEEDIDYDWDENPLSWGIRTILVTSDGLRFYEYDYEDALEHECWWLQQEAMAVVKENLD